MDTIEEIWADVLGYEGKYQVSNRGRVKTCAHVIVNSLGRSHSIREKIRKTVINCQTRYDTITIGGKSKAKTFSIHRLVALAFIPNPENKKQVNHINGVRDDNRVENLAWATSSDFILEANHSSDYRTDIEIAHPKYATSRPANLTEGMSETIVNKLL